jgi:hypothetical protein
MKWLRSIALRFPSSARKKLHQNARYMEMAAGKGLKEGFSNAKDWKRFSTHLAAAYNILITPSPERDRGNGLETRPGIEFQTGDVIPKLSALAGAFAL